MFWIKAMDLTCTEYAIEMNSKDRHEEGTHEFAMEGVTGMDILFEVRDLIVSLTMR